MIFFFQPLGSFLTSSSYRQKPVYKRKHNVLVVQAFVNGTHLRPVRATAPDIFQVNLLFESLFFNFSKTFSYSTEFTLRNVENP